MMKRFFVFFLVALCLALTGCGGSHSGHSKDKGKVSCGGNGLMKCRVVDYQPDGLPVIKIDTANSAPIVSKDDYIDATLTLSDPSDSSNDFTVDTQIKGRGNQTWTFAKKPYRLKFSKKQSVFGLPKAKSWVLLAEATDPTLLFTSFAFEVEKRFKENSGSGEFYNHYFPVDLILNGQYRGVYILTEQIQVNKGRIDIDENNGWLADYDHVQGTGDIDFFTDLFKYLVEIKSPDGSEDANDPGYDFVKSDINGMEAGLTQGDLSMIDIPSAVDLVMINDLVHNEDFYMPGDIYFYKDAGDGALIKFGPVWDVDHGYGITNPKLTEPYKVENYGTPFSTISGFVFMNKLFANANYRAEYKARWEAMKPEIVDAIDNWIPAQAAKIEAARAQNFKAWHWVKNPKHDPDADTKTLQQWLHKRVELLDESINAM